MSPLVKILIVDVALTNILVLAEILRNDCRTIFATNGAVALKMASQERPDIFLLNTLMDSEMDGHSLRKT